MFSTRDENGLMLADFRLQLIDSQAHNQAAILFVQCLISFTPTSNNTFDRDGTWEGQVQFTASGILVLTVIFEMEVEKKI